MFQQREKAPPKAADKPKKPRAPKKGDNEAFQTPFADPDVPQSRDEDEVRRERHATLMECLADERDRQAEERQQAAIDEDFYDHLQWRPEDAAVLIQRGQAPLVFNRARQTIDWIAGAQKRMRKDYKILGREKGDEAGAQVVTQVIKYTDDANLTPWHDSRAFKQAAISGLGWLEEGINTTPGEEIIYSGSEDWRNVYRDSRDRGFDQKKSRYLFRRVVTDMDYAMALLPRQREHLRNMAKVDESPELDDPWYLGERLTGASDITFEGMPMSSFRDRRGFIGTDYTDRGRRRSVELLECWYRVPETVDVFSGGPLAGQVFDPTSEGHLQQQRDRHMMYQATRMAMRVMVATKDAPLWDGSSPFAHNEFLLIPVWGYRRYRDGVAYGAMRGMRDLQEDSNKRASKAQFLLANNRVIADENAVEDIDEAREEFNRPDGWVAVRTGKKVELQKHVGEVAGNLEMMDRNMMFMQDIGGVTNENLGRDTNANSGIAIERKQDQGSLTTSELFDNFLLAKKMAGRRRLSHIKQWFTQEKTIRILGEGQPVEWVQLNYTDPQTGQVMNDLAAINCDYIVSEQDYRESYVRAATQEMFELLGQIATFAPQVVLSVLDLAVEGSEVRNKDEWVRRIRELNGQRDPSKEMTPEEEEAKAQKSAKAKLAEDIQFATLKAQLDKLLAEISKMGVEKMAKTTDSFYAALQAAQIVAQTPQVAPIADVIVQGAGYQDARGTDPNIPQPTAPVAPAQPISADPNPQGLDGIHAGIETPTPADNFAPV